MPVRATADTVRVATPFFPTPTDDTNNREDVPIERPQHVGPILDEAHASQPIAPWDDGYHQENYTEALNENSSAETPAQPTDFNDTYLFPMLAKNERQRLTMLWYYTRNIQQDAKLMQRLNDKIGLVKDFMGWEFAIVGILSNNNYIRIATAGLPLAILPRRESTCSHTINQQSGSVLWLEDTTKDWRFKNSPHVASSGGLRSYAGTQLRFRTSTGDDVALGSLCIASNEASQPFSPERKDALIRFAAMFTDEIINGARAVRHKVRHVMTELIAEIKARSEEPDIEQVVIDIVQQIYPNARVTIQASASGLISVRGRAPFSYNNIPDGIWEDSDYLEKLIISHNHEDLVASQSVRAIVGRSAQLPIPRYLVVDSMEVELVFDDIDAWFIERSALTLCNILQRRVLEEAIRAKEIFLRGITHQLRTPIHGVLASADLLAEELALRDTLVEYGAVDMNKYASSKDNAESILSTINSSGKELLATVNGILKLNRWAGLQGPQKAETYRLEDLEQDLCKDMSEALALSHHEEVTIFFDNRLEPPTPIKTDPELLRECLSALAQNAMSYTEKGYINITLSQSDDNTLIVDVVDTGSGIKCEDQKRIFEACERANTTIQGAGLGLTLASKIAARMNGSVVLVSSILNHGSHFRARFPDLLETPPTGNDVQPSVIEQLKYLPRNWYRLQVEGQQCPVATPLSKFLGARGISQDHVLQDSLVFIDYTEDAQALDKVLSSVDKLLSSIEKTQTRLCLVPAGKSSEHLNDISTKHDITFCSGPFTTARMEGLLKRVDAIYGELSKSGSQFNEQSTSRSQRMSIQKRPSISSPILPQQKKAVHRSFDTKPCALLVDDNAINLHILKVYCEKRGIAYTTAMDGNQAVAAFKAAQDKDPFNLILMDLQMPECDGIQATEQIRHIEANASVFSNRQPAVIFMITGQDSAEDRQRGEAAGCDAYHVKPVGIKALDQAIKPYFRHTTPGVKNAMTARPGSVDGATDNVPIVTGQKRGRVLQVDSRKNARDDSLHREVRRASMSCHPRSEAVLTSSPTDDVPQSSGLQTVMDEARRVDQRGV